MKKYLLLILVLLISGLSIAQKDSVDTKLLYSNLAFDAVLITGSYIALDHLWYKDYEQTELHWFNDCDEWLYVDKLGHAFSTYHVSSIYSKQMQWSGLNQNKSAVIGSALGFITISTIELLDAKSKQWGASHCDLIANFSGSSIYLIQELAWKEQRVTLKFSYHSTSFAEQRPELLGTGFTEQLMKDYNGQTYWLSANIASFTSADWMPKYLNLAVGYGATGMLGGESNPVELAYYDRESQYYLSLDIDLRKIKVKSKILKKVFSLVNILKIPMPTIELRSGKLYGHYLYF